MTPSEWTNAEWLEALKVDREDAWAALRGLQPLIRTGESDVEARRDEIAAFLAD